MPRTCTVCRHPERGAIDCALAALTPLRVIAGRYGLTRSAVGRHFDDHLPAQVRAAQAAQAEGQALDVLQQLKAINAAALAVLKDARDHGDGDLVLRAVDRVQRQIELQAKLLGELDERPQVNLLVSPEWTTVRTAILAALAPYPPARVAVAERLSALEAL